MELVGYISEYKRRNEKTGESWFNFVSDSNLYHCHGVVLKYPYRMPIMIICEQMGFNKPYEVLSAHLSNNEPLLIEFLKTKEFEGFGDVFAPRFLNKIKENTQNDDINIFEYSKDYNKNQYTDNENKALSKIRYHALYQSFYEYLLSRNFDFFNISKIYNIYGQDTLDIVNANPYTMLFCGASIKLCEALAKDNGIQYCDKKRIRGLVEVVMLRNSSNGNSRIKFSELIYKFNYLVEKEIKRNNKALNISFYDEKIDPVFIAEEVLSDRYTLINTDDDIYVYLRSDYETEIGIKHNILKFFNNKKTYEYKADIDEIEAMFDIKYAPEQKRAFELLNSSGIKLLTGDPGSGKTTVINGLIYQYRLNHPDKGIALCAPTGCAARRLQESTNNPATTIHRLLDIRPHTNLLKNKITQLTQDLIIVDESSMVDMYIAFLLLSSIKPEATVVFVGDPNQLESVGMGDFFLSLINSQKFEHCHLNTIYRQDSRSDIAINSKLIAESNTNLIKSDKFKIFRLDNQDMIVNKVEKIAKQCYENNIDFTLFTPSKKSKFKTGSINMNRQLSNIYCQTKNQDYSEEKEVFFGVYIFRVGDKVIFNQNNYDLGFFNGLSGSITCIQKFDNSVYVSVKTDDDIEITLKDNELEFIELGYAITAHKAQGSECDNAVIIIPQEPVSLSLKRLLYVEVTRARKNIIIFSEGNAIDKAIINRSERIRDTGLNELFKGL